MPPDLRRLCVVGSSANPLDSPAVRLLDSTQSDDAVIRSTSSTDSYAVQQQISFNAVHRRPNFKVDVFVRPVAGFFAAQLGRAREFRIHALVHQRVSVSTPEDILFMKLRWSRRGSEVSDLLDRALVESGLPPIEHPGGGAET